MFIKHFTWNREEKKNLKKEFHNRKMERIAIAENSTNPSKVKRTNPLIYLDFPSKVKITLHSKLRFEAIMNSSCGCVKSFHFKNSQFFCIPSHWNVILFSFGVFRWIKSLESTWLVNLKILSKRFVKSFCFL